MGRRRRSSDSMIAPARLLSVLSLEPRTKRSEGIMRSIQSRNCNSGIQNAQPSVKATIRRDSDRRPSYAMWCAFMGYASRCWLSVREELQHLTAVTGVLKSHVTGGALCAVALQRSGQHATCCLAAR